MSPARFVRWRTPRTPIGPHARLRRRLATSHVHPHLLDEQPLNFVVVRTLPPAGASKRRRRRRRHVRRWQHWVGGPGTGRGTRARRAPRAHGGPGRGPRRGPCRSRSRCGPWGLCPHHAPSSGLRPFLRQLPGSAFLLRLLPRPLCALRARRRPRRGRSRGVCGRRPASGAAGSCALGGREPLDLKRWSLCGGRGRSGALGHRGRDAGGRRLHGHL
jgi:hypothetical protein